MKLEPRIWRHTFLRGEDEETLRVLRHKADSLKPQKSSDDTEDYDKAVAEADAFAEDAKPRGTEVILRSITSRKKMREIRAACPPREGNDDDKAAGFNVEEYAEKLVSASLASPALNDEDREEFLDSLTDGEFEFLMIAADSLHRGLGASPK